MNPRPITCREFIEFIMDYVDGELTDSENEVFAHHLSVCVACVDYLASYNETARLAAELANDPEAELPDGVPEDLILAILNARPRN